MLIQQYEYEEYLIEQKYKKYLKKEVGNTENVNLGQKKRSQTIKCVSDNTVKRDRNSDISIEGKDVHRNDTDPVLKKTLIEGSESRRNIVDTNARQKSGKKCLPMNNQGDLEQRLNCYDQPRETGENSITAKFKRKLKGNDGLDIKEEFKSFRKQMKKVISQIDSKSPSRQNPTNICETSSLSSMLLQDFVQDKSSKFINETKNNVLNNDGESSEGRRVVVTNDVCKNVNAINETCISYADVFDDSVKEKDTQEIKCKSYTTNCETEQKKQNEVVLIDFNKTNEKRIENGFGNVNKSYSIEKQSNIQSKFKQLAREFKALAKEDVPESKEDKQDNLLAESNEYTNHIVSKKSPIFLIDEPEGDDPQPKTIATEIKFNPCDKSEFGEERTHSNDVEGNRQHSEFGEERTHSNDVEGNRQHCQQPLDLQTGNECCKISSGEKAIPNVNNNQTNLESSPTNEDVTNSNPATNHSINKIKERRSEIAKKEMSSSHKALANSSKAPQSNVVSRNVSTNNKILDAKGNRKSKRMFLINKSKLGFSNSIDHDVGELSFSNFSKNNETGNHTNENGGSLCITAEKQNQIPVPTDLEEPPKATTKGKEKTNNGCKLEGILTQELLQDANKRNEQTENRATPKNVTKEDQALKNVKNKPESKEKRPSLLPVRNTTNCYVPRKPKFPFNPMRTRTAMCKSKKKS